MLIFWRREVVVKREEPQPPSFDFKYPEGYQPAKWGLWARIKYRVTGKGFRPYVPGVVRKERVTLRRRVVLLFSRKPAPPPPRPMVVRTLAVGAVRTGARREPWRWWMLFTRRGADMTIGDWLQEKKADWAEWPLTWKLGPAIPGMLVGWIVAHQYGWPVKPCMLAGGVLGIMSPLIFLEFLEGVVIFSFFALIFGAIYWAFQDTAAMQTFVSDMGRFFSLLWASLQKLFG